MQFKNFFTSTTQTFDKFFFYPKIRYMTQLKWKDAIVKVFEDEKKALHYTEIAELIAEKGYRKSLGATPQDTVSASITTDINSYKEKSIFARVDKGVYILRKFLENSSDLEASDIESKTVIIEKTTKEIYKIINSFGIYWNRTLVHWKSYPDLLGIQQVGASEVNFREQIGIYLLHDGRETIYVGQAIDQPLGKRLKIHTIDRLSGRWDRFSWFGFYPISDKGNLITDVKLDNFTFQNLGDLLEAVLIESMEPRQNRKQGNLFSGLEFLQLEAPEIQKIQKQQLIKELTEKL